jgi:phosphoribosylformylglycinamidine cyclo-ligase
MELYVDEHIAQEIIGVCADFRLDARIVGRCEAAKGKQLTIKTSHGTFSYQ